MSLRRAKLEISLYLKMKVYFQYVIFSILIFSCTTKIGSQKEYNDWPKEITDLPVGLKVINNPNEIYASLNQKDSLKYKYKLAFETEVRALKEDLEIVDFGGYIWDGNKWVFQSMYGRPFNKQEFIKWYGSNSGEISLDFVYADRNNWLVKTNNLNGSSMRFLNYFIAKNAKGEKFYGVSEVIGYQKLN